MATRRDWLKGIAALLLARDALAQGRVQAGASLVRGNSSLSVLADGLRILTGALLLVFAPRERREIRTSTATIGIRGTAVYIEAELTLLESLVGRRPPFTPGQDYQPVN